jgi:hypothetical protein
MVGEIKVAECKYSVSDAISQHTLREEVRRRVLRSRPLSARGPVASGQPTPSRPSAGPSFCRPLYYTIRAERGYGAAYRPPRRLPWGGSVKLAQVCMPIARARSDSREGRRRAGGIGVERGPGAGYLTEPMRVCENENERLCTRYLTPRQGRLYIGFLGLAHVFCTSPSRCPVVKLRLREEKKKKVPRSGMTRVIY